MIEKDLRARSKSTRGIKDYATVVHRHWPTEAKNPDAKTQKQTKVGRTSKQEQASKDQLGGMDEFLDEELDLADVEDIFKRASSRA